MFEIGFSSNATGARERASPPIDRRASPPAPSLHEAVLDQLPQALVVIDASARPSFCNAAARVRLATTGWSMAGGPLRPPHAADQAAFSRALEQTCTRGLIRMLCLTVGTRTLHAALTPLDVQGQRLALLLLGNDASCGPIELQLFAQLNGLTAAEARVLAGLNRGRRPAQIAREHEVALTTVQSQISAVRAKTQSASIFSLVARLARLPAIKAALDSGSSDAA